MTHPVSNILDPVLRPIRRYLAVVAICALAVPAIAVLIAGNQEERYEASASVLLRNLPQRLVGGPSDPVRDLATATEVINLARFAERTGRALGGEPSAVEIEDAVEVTSTGTADVVRIDVTYPDPVLAAEIANTYAAEYIAFQRRIDKQATRGALAELGRELRSLERTRLNRPIVRELASEGTRIRLIQSAQKDRAKLVDPAEAPDSATDSGPWRNGAIGAVLGLLLGVGLAMLLDRFDPRLKSAQEAVEIFRRPLLGVIPSGGRRAAGDKRGQGASEAEAYQLLRANLRHLDGGGRRTVLVTSPGRREGKSMVSWNLAAASAAAGMRVLLIEASIRDPLLAGRLGARTEIGLTSVLSGATDLEGATQRLRIATDGGDTTSSVGFTLLAAGPRAQNPSRLLESGRIAELIREAESGHDLVLVDAPLSMADALPLIRLVDGLVVTMRLDETTREAAIRLRDELHQLRAPTIGVVVEDGPAAFNGEIVELSVPGADESGGRPHAAAASIAS